MVQQPQALDFGGKSVVEAVVEGVERSENLNGDRLAGDVGHRGEDRPHSAATDPALQLIRSEAF